MTRICDNQVVLYISSNRIFHEKTKHTEIVLSFYSRKDCIWRYQTKCVNSNDQLANIFTKSL